MSADKIILEYRGKVDMETIDSLLDKLKTVDEFSLLNKGLQKRLYCILVESAENINRYQAAAPVSDQIHEPYILVELDEDQFSISTGNLVSSESVSDLRTRIDQINQLDQKGLKAYYRKIISQEIDRSDKGAGLGLLMIALQSNKSLKYTLTPAGEELMYFELHSVVINNECD